MSLKFLFYPSDGVGHINAHTGIGQELVRNGHSVFFAVSNSWKGKLAPFGFVEKFYQEETHGQNTLNAWNEMVEKNRDKLALSSIETKETFTATMCRQSVANVKEANSGLKKIVDEVQPDLIIIDFIRCPALTDSGIPWMIVMSHNPVGITTEDSPPFCNGYGFLGDRTLWAKYREVQLRVVGPIYKDFSEWVLDNGGSELTYDGRNIWTPDSPYENLYMLPKELDYATVRPNPPNWHQFDAFTRHEPQNFEIPEKLRSGPGKLIYFSLGTIGCSEMELMRKFMNILAKSPNRFIISAGPSGDQLVLADNMWGGNSLPQTSILPLVDLVITHGGNNTLTESFYFGKRVIVLPVFGDQLDNAIRVEETGLGLQFHPYHVTQEELLNGIEKLLKDNLLEKRMQQISVRMQASKSQARAAEMLENVAKNNTKRILNL